MTKAHQIDPAKVDVIAQAPKKKRKRKPRRKMANARPSPEATEAARKRLVETRPHSPGVMIEPGKGDNSYSVQSPHEDVDAWEVQICAAFGTRSWSTMKTFISHLRDLCGQAYDHDAEQWVPNERELNAMLNIVNGVQPANEMQAMLAAQMCAIHFLQMKASGYALSNHGSWVEPKNAATISMLSRTFVRQMEELRRQQVKPRRTTKQKIEVHHHTHQHIHMEGGGSGIGGQPHTSGETIDVRKSVERAGSSEGCAALPSPDKGGEVVPLRRNEGKAGLPDARGDKPRRANGRS